MTTGEKIKYYRSQRGISQEILAELSGIHVATIKKYELGIRNPKPEQLLKIANALGISINVFLDLDISTISDVLSLLFKMDDEIDMNLSADKDEEGNYIPKTLQLSFENSELNRRLCQYMKAKELPELQDKMDEIKQKLIDSNMVIRKGTTGITVKVPQFFTDM